ncbi:hypothetical protein [Ferrimonas sediminum]|uniref:hypothetical protein n=1 Tax=Ferrimonas sediminum TaxID=718193 RepID=UPI0015A07DA0|nr:hypothetical protein [Ferrimonas sediminum]
MQPTANGLAEGGTSLEGRAAGDVTCKPIIIAMGGGDEGQPGHQQMPVSPAGWQCGF